MKFAQAEVTDWTSLAAVFRFKKDFLVMPKKGGKVTSTVDHRVTFVAQKGTFSKKEHFVAQVRICKLDYRKTFLDFSETTIITCVQRHPI